MKRSDELKQRLKDVIVNTCNTLGCKNCDLKWPTSCSAMELQSQVFDAETEEQNEVQG